MKTIYKYQLASAEENKMRLRGKILSAGVQNGSIMIWAVHDDQQPECEVTVSVMGTGHDFVNADDRDFIGTVFLGPFVFHVFASPNW